MSDKTVNNGGIGFLGLLTIVFVIAKLTGYITWPWLWVFAPVIIGIVVGLIIFVIIFFIAIVAAK